MVISDLETHARQVGYATEFVKARGGEYLVIKEVLIGAGGLAGSTCDVAIKAAGGNPWVPEAAIHTRPHMVPMGNLNTKASPVGPEWQYWSRRFDRPPTPKSFLAHVLTILSGV